MRGSLVLLLAAGLAGATLVGCGDDTQVLPVADAATGDVIHPDAQPGEGGGGDAGDAGEAGDGACNYATFVLGLINSHTTNTDQPSTDLGQNCVDHQDQTEFKSLFP